MKRMIMMLLVSTAMSAPAMAASVTNKDADTQVLVIEDGSRVEVALEPGATETICPSGCFVTLPNGDRIALNGAENVEIEGGEASVK